MALTKLSTLIARAQRFKGLITFAESDLVQNFDSSLREQMRTIDSPYRLKKSTLRIFDNVLEYPAAADHEDIMYLETQKAGNDYWEKARFQYTSIQQFYENPEDRNYLATLFDNGVKFLGVRYQQGLNVPNSVGVDSSQSLNNWSLSGDANNLFLDSVNVKNNNYSIGFSINNSLGYGTAQKILDNGISTTNYQKNYYFVDVYLSSVPTSITLSLLCDNSNYLSQTIATQFSGQPLIANDWNTLAFDLNTATEVGTVGPTFNIQSITITGGATGTYNIGQSFLREWVLMDYRYYSIYNCQTVNATQPDQEFFIDDNGNYSDDTFLVSEAEFADIIFYDGCLMALSDNSRAGSQNSTLIQNFSQKLQDAINALAAKHPDEEPVIITSRYNFNNNFDYPDASPNNWLD